MKLHDRQQVEGTEPVVYIGQGAKTLTLADDVFRYDPAHYAVTMVGIPITAKIVEASSRRPYLGLRLTLNPAVVSSVIAESQVRQAARGEAFSATPARKRSNRVPSSPFSDTSSPSTICVGGLRH